jgi:hypothetical protein
MINQPKEVGAHAGGAAAEFSGQTEMLSLPTKLGTQSLPDETSCALSVRAKAGDAGLERIGRGRCGSGLVDILTKCEPPADVFELSQFS